MHYAIVIHKEDDSDYGVTVPDLPGCFSAGANIDEAMAMAKEAIELHLEGLIEEGLSIPEPATVQAHQHKREYRNGTWAVVAVDPSTLRIKAKRISVTMPERTLDAVDQFASEAGETRSGLLTRAVTDYIGRKTGHAPSKIQTRRGRRPKRQHKGR